MADNKGKKLYSYEKEITSHSKDTKLFNKKKIIKKQKKGILFPLIILLVLITIIIAGGFIYFLIIKKNNKIENQEKNSIIATYINSGEEIQFINDNILDNIIYEIELIDLEYRYRNLQIIKLENTFEFTGEITITINFFKKVNSLEKLFENISHLKEVNFTNFDMSEVTSLDSTFSGCSSLEKVIFDGVDSRNLRSMNFLFKNCTNLKDVDLSPLNILSVDKMNSPFQGCRNLKVNISSFPRIKDDFLLGNYSNISFIANEKIYDKLNIFCQECEKEYILDNNTNKEINERTKEENEKGEKDNESDNESGNKKKEKQEEICILGEVEKCKSCKEEKGMKNQCSRCNEGYYLPIDQSPNLKCESCKKIENCISCNGAFNFPTCNECEIGFKKCGKKPCIIGTNEKCKSCKYESEECLSCNEGYFLPEDSNDKTKCTKCQLKGCKTCSGNIIYNQCSECFEYPEIKYGKIILCHDKENTDHCSYFDINNNCIFCVRYYKLVDGKCTFINNIFYAIYNVVSTEKPTKIMCNHHLNLELSDLTMYDNGEIVYPSIIKGVEGRSLTSIVYTFKSLGFHNVTVSIHRILYNSIGWMFGNCESLVSIKFDKDFDTRYVTSIYDMFCLDRMLVSVDMSSFNTSYLVNMNGVFWKCESIEYIDLSNFDTSKVTKMQGIFDYCKNLSYIDISSFNMTKVNNTESMFYNVAKNGVIKIGKHFGDYKKLIPKNWNIIE